MHDRGCPPALKEALLDLGADAVPPAKAGGRERSWMRDIEERSTRSSRNTTISPNMPDDWTAATLRRCSPPAAVPKARQRQLFEHSMPGALSVPMLVCTIINVQAASRATARGRRRADRSRQCRAGHHDSSSPTTISRRNSKTGSDPRPADHCARTTGFKIRLLLQVDTLASAFRLHRERRRRAGCTAVSSGSKTSIPSRCAGTKKRQKNWEFARAQAGASEVSDWGPAIPGLPDDTTE
jgi:hypothetical protein